MKCTEKELARAAAYRANRRKLGQCLGCTAQTVPGKTRCAAHLEQIRLKSQARAQENRTLGLCQKCSQPAVPGKSNCKDCARHIAAVENTRIKRLRGQGTCPRCLQPLLGVLWCLPCYVRITLQRNTGSSVGWEILVAKLEAQQFLCPYTGDLLHPGVNLSLDHIHAISKGGTHAPDNLEWVSTRVNVMKQELSRTEFVALCAKIVSHTSKTP